jgi:hypothetical protein
VRLAVLTLLCAWLIGFAAHRASLCNVRAVDEILAAGNPHMLVELLQAVLWMASLTGVLVLVFGLSPLAAPARTPLGWAAAGGALFGLGAGINGGCSLSTLHRLADGDLGMLLTLGGFVLGIGAWVAGMEAVWPASFAMVQSPWLRWPQWAPWMLAALLLWSALQLRRFWRRWRQDEAAGLRARLLARSYHVSTSAALIGLSGGLLYATVGAWSYTNFLRAQVAHRLGTMMAPMAWHAILVAAVLAGMLMSALQRRSFAWRAPEGLSAAVRRAAGGFCMGVGAALIPGGNDTLLLGGLPNLTSAALAAYASMLVGIGASLRLLRP